VSVRSGECSRYRRKGSNGDCKKKTSTREVRVKKGELQRQEGGGTPSSAACSCLGNPGKAKKKRGNGNRHPGGGQPERKTKTNLPERGREKGKHDGNRERDVERGGIDETRKKKCENE